MNPTNAPVPASSPRNGETKQAIRQLKRESRWHVCRTISSILCFMVALSIFLLALTPAWSEAKIQMLVLTLGCLVAGGLLVPPLNSKALAILAESPGTTMIGPLLEALETAPEAKSAKIRALLTQLLPQLQASDAKLLAKRHRRSLYNALLLGDADREEAYLRAVLQSVTAIGDHHARHCLEQVVLRGAVTRGQRRLLEAAAECLGRVEARQAQEHIRDSLLRAASPAVSSEELLRSVASNPEIAPQILLRPGKERE